MAHFARIRRSDNQVMQVVVICNTEVAHNGDPAAETYCQKLFKTDPSKFYWKQTSYNTSGGKHWSTVDGVRVESEDQSKAFRGNYAGKGMFYDEEHDLFYVPKSEVGMNGWVFDINKASWVPPKDFPSTNHLPNGIVVYYNWDDATLGWLGETTEGVEVRWDSATDAWISI